MTKHPSCKKVSLRDLEVWYGAMGIWDALVEYLICLHTPNMTRLQMEDAVDSFHLPFQSVAVYHKIKFWVQDEQGFSGHRATLDSVHVRPLRVDKHGKEVPGWFYTVLYQESNQTTSIQGELTCYLPFFDPILILNINSNFFRSSCCPSSCSLFYPTIFFAPRHQCTKAPSICPTLFTVYCPTKSPLWHVSGQEMFQPR